MEIGGIDMSLSGCWEWQNLNGGQSNWYPRLRQQKVSRLVCGLVHGKPVNPGLRPLHACDNKHCVRPDHLRWGTQGENVEDIWARLRPRKSERTP